MSEKSKIAWTDSTLNFWEGCTKVSDGCKNCYAEARDKRFHGHNPNKTDSDGHLQALHWGKGAPRRKSKSAVKDAFSFNRKPWICDKCGHAEDNIEPTESDRKRHGDIRCDECGATMHRRRIFSLSLGDWLDDEVPIEWLAEMLDTIDKCKDVTWILCTKRPENFKQRMMQVAKCPGLGGAHKGAWMALAWGSDGTIPPNVIVLTSVENQQEADKRIPQLLAIPAACRGLSLEPLLGPVDFEGPKLEWIAPFHDTDAMLKKTPRIEWIIIGGESGTGARFCNVEWIRNIIAQGKAAGVATFVKQIGARWVAQIHEDERDFTTMVKHPKGGDPSEWPADLRVQEWPKGF